jgi:cytochrome P450
VQRRQMDTVFELNFGAGSRKCIGRNISWIEMMKVVPELLRRFRVDLTHPEQEWEICNHWFVQQEGMVCNLTSR